MNEGWCAQDVHGAQGSSPARSPCMVAGQGWSPALQCGAAAGRLPPDRYT